MFSSVEGLEVRSAGTRWTARNRVSRELIDWADKIFVMEEEHKKHIIENRPRRWVRSLFWAFQTPTTGMIRF